MAYKLKPNYHFANVDELGIDKVPLGRIVVVEDYGVNNEVKWFKKVSNELRDIEGNSIGILDETHSINDAQTFLAIESPLDEKADVNDIYTQTEIDSMASLKADLLEVYTKEQAEFEFRRITESYDISEIDSILDGVSKNSTGIIQQSASVNSDVEIEYGNNAASLGPILLENGVTVTVNDGSVWQII
jgi:hypothetical protein